MANYAAVFGGVSGKATFDPVTYSDNLDIKVILKFRTNKTGGLISGGGTSRYFRYSSGSLRFRSSSSTYSTWPFSPVLDQRYTFDVECRESGVELFIDAISQGVKNGGFGTWLVDTIAMYNNGAFSDVEIERVSIVDNNIPANTRDFFNDEAGGASLIWPDKSANNKDATLEGTSTDGSQWELVGGVTPTDLIFSDAIIQPIIDLVAVDRISSLNFNDLLVDVKADLITIESISLLGIDDLLVQAYADSTSLENISLLGFSSLQLQPTIDVIDIKPSSGEIDLSDNLVQPIFDTMSISNITELSIYDILVPVTGDSINVANITELSIGDSLVQPIADAIVIDVVGGLVFSDVTVKPTIDTVAIELYTELEFSDLSVRTTTDTILISTGVMPDFGNNDLLLIDNTTSYLLVDNTTDYRTI